MMCLGEGLIQIATFAFRQRFGLLGSASDSVWDWNVAARPLVYMAVETVVLFACVLLIERDVCQLSRVSAWVQYLLCGGGLNLRCCRATPSWRMTAVATTEPHPNTGSASVVPDPEKEDEDVARERARIEGYSGVVTDMIVLQRLAKTYPARSGGASVTAVYSSSFGIPKGECFGLLGK
jgi:ATP-binding cassette subfamily A (ABC1) protein 3